ncbi:lysophospholipid acyltransferase family protein [Rhizobium sp. CFBP 8762]|uniref:lysophospholipid acyltransferase family protein n=1 Tax=Rhizobium sp. CFBP 8762 TaxID=2775279 RepID=UPI001FD0E866|nr:lysophospholipid acyltransferase family protein [Rhizobium sp. CFBP 8762]
MMDDISVSRSGFVTRLRVGLVLVGIVAITLVLLPLQVLFIKLRLKFARSLPRLWHRAVCTMMGLRVRVHGVPSAQRPLMLASNHVSWSDILVLGSVLDVTFVAKSEVRDWPVFGALARLQRTIFVEREMKRKVGEQSDEIGNRMKAGEIVVLFPEGTTSDGNRLLDIKTSLFGAAASAVREDPQNPVHIQPVAIAYTGVHGMAMGRYHRPIAAWPGDITLLPHLMGVLREGALEVDVVFGDPVAYAADSNRKLVSREVESRLRTILIRALRGRL